MSCQEVLIVKVLGVLYHDAASDNEDVLAGAGTQMDRVMHSATETIWVIGLNLLATSDLLWDGFSRV